MNFGRSRLVKNEFWQVTIKLEWYIPGGLVGTTSIIVCLYNTTDRNNMIVKLLQKNVNFCVFSPRSLKIETNTMD